MTPDPTSPPTFAAAGTYPPLPSANPATPAPKPKGIPIAHPKQSSILWKLGRSMVKGPKLGRRPGSRKWPNRKKYY